MRQNGGVSLRVLDNRRYLALFTCMAMSSSGKSFAVWMGLSFFVGILIGYKIKGLRIKYLQAKRKYLEKKLAETRKKIDCEAGETKSTTGTSGRGRSVAGVVITA